MTQKEKAIEIPFGAKDSELLEWVYFIPEGMEAEIKDRKVIIKKAESEDERTRKELIEFIQWSVDRHFIREDFHQAKRPSEWIAYLEKQKETKSNIEKLKEISTPADEDWFEIQKKWEKEDEQKEQKPVDEPFEEWIDGWFKEHKEKAYPQITMDEKEFKNFCRGIRNMYAEQKPTESISQLTVQGKGVYKICPRCKERMVRDDSMVYTSMPPQYGYKCPKCGEIEFDTVMYDNPEIKEQKPISQEDFDRAKHGALWEDQKPEWSEEEKRAIDRACVALRAYANGDLPEFLPSELIGYADRLQSLRPQPKPEWGEEDEERLELVIDCVYEYYPDPVMKYKLKDWLKSLPKRFNLQPKPEVECDNETEIQKAYREGKNAGRKEVFDHPEEYGLQPRRMYDYETGKRNPEWSEEDKEILDGLISLYSNTYSGEKWPWKKGGYITYGDVVNFLKSLRPSWKPSEGQMEALDEYIYAKDPNTEKYSKAVLSLRDDLKKLM